MALAPDQRASLWRAKLRALARDQLNRPDGDERDAPWGAVLVADGVWTALIEIEPTRSFGQAMVMAERGGAAELDLLVEAPAAAAVARRAELFAPAPKVWAVVGTSVSEARPDALERVDAPELRADLAEVLAMPEVLTVVEHGCTIAECRGLEVARVTGVGDEQRLDVGVGAYDQGAFAVMNPDLTSQESLAEVVAQVLTHRRRGAEPHPINRLVRERWLRSELLDDASSLGLGPLDPIAGAVARDGLHDVAPAFAIDRTAGVVVACSVGIDLDLVPAAAEVAAREGASRLVLVLPQRDHHSATRAVAARCVFPIELVAADEPWPS